MFCIKYWWLILKKKCKNKTENEGEKKTENEGEDKVELKRRIVYFCLRFSIATSKSTSSEKAPKL